MRIAAAVARGLRALNERLRRQPLLFAVVFVLLNGVDWTDLDDFFSLVSHPARLHPQVDHQFLHSSPLNFLLGAGLAGPFGACPAFVIVHAAGLIFVALAFAVFLRGLPGRREDAALVFWSAPLLLVLTQWFGK